MINLRDSYEMESIKSAVSNSFLCLQWVEQLGIVPSIPRHTQSRQRKALLTSPSHWDTPVVKSQPEQRGAHSLLCYLDKMLLVFTPLSLKSEFCFNQTQSQKDPKFQISLKVSGSWATLGSPWNPSLWKQKTVLLNWAASWHCQRIM